VQLLYNAFDLPYGVPQFHWISTVPPLRGFGAPWPELNADSHVKSRYNT
jgi:hypothetical protein